MDFQIFKIISEYIFLTVAFTDPLTLLVDDVVRRRGQLFAKVVKEGERQIIYRYYQDVLTGNLKIMI